jgi:hypothetical protein
MKKKTKKALKSWWQAAKIALLFALFTAFILTYGYVQFTKGATWMKHQLIQKQSLQATENRYQHTVVGYRNEPAQSIYLFFDKGVYST